MKKILLFICFLASTHLVRGQELDQQMTESDGFMTVTSSFGQIFTVGKTGGLTSIDLLLSTLTPGTKTLSVYPTDVNGLPILTTALASSTKAVPSFGSVTFDFPSPLVQLNAGIKYAFVINNISTARSITSKYAGGNYFLINNDNSITQDPSIDLFFKTYSRKFEPVTTTSATCNGAPNGGAVVKPLFGTAPYSYTWDNGETTATATKLTGGNHTLTVKDVNNITEQLSVTIGQPLATPLVFSATVETFVGAMCNNKGVIPGNTPLPVQLLPTTYDNTKITLGNDATVSTTNGEYTLTPDQNDKKGYLLFNSTETQPKLFTAKFSLKGDNKSGADGFSFNYGEINTATSGSYENGILAKDASNNDKGLVIKFLTFNTDKIQIYYNGVKIGSDVATLIEDGSYHNYEVTMTLSLGKYRLTLKKDNSALITDAIVADYGNFNPTANYRLAIAARTGGSNNNYRVGINPMFTDNTPYEYSLDNITFTDNGYFQDIPAGQQKFFARLPGMTCGKLLGTYTITGTAPPAAPTVTSPQTFPSGSKISDIVRPAAPTNFSNATYSDAAGTIGVGTNTLLQSKTYYLSFNSLDGQCQGLLTPVVINVDNIPTIDKIATVDVCNSNTADVAVKLTDEDVNALTLTAISSDTNILPNSGLTISGTGANRTVKITPTINVSGIVTITLTAKDVNNTTVSNFVVRIVNESTPAGIKIFAGNGNASVVADNVLPTATHLVNPKYVAVDKTGNVFIGEYQKVRRIDKANGKITTIATTTGTTEIKGVTVDKAGNVFFTDGAIIYKLTAGAGTAVKYAGSSNGTQVNDNTGVANANIGAIQFMYMDNFDNIYVITDGGARIRLILPDANKTLRDAAGTGVDGYDDDGSLATSTKISGVTGLTKDASGNIYFTLSTTVENFQRNAVRKISESTKRVSTVFSSYPPQNQQSPTPTYPLTSSLSNCKGIDIGADNILYVAQEYNILQIFGSNYENAQTLMGSAREIPDNSPYGFMGVAYDSSTDLLLLPAYQTSGNSTEQSQRVYRYVPNINVTCNTVLPVTLTNFTAKAEGSKSRIEWTTASEHNNNRFEVQRSTDGINFATIATVKGNGNSNATNRYIAYDAQPTNGVNYYRLKQIDTDGKETIVSEIKSVTFNFATDVIVKVYPNPATDVINVAIQNYSGNKLNIAVIDATGKLVHKESVLNLNGNTNIKLNIEGKLAPGLYTIKLSSDTYNKALKLIVNQ